MKGNYDESDFCCNYSEIPNFLIYRKINVERAAGVITCRFYFTFSGGVHFLRSKARGKDTLVLLRFAVTA
jgi:hypothetical protein